MKPRPGRSGLPALPRAAPGLPGRLRRIWGAVDRNTATGHVLRGRPRPREHRLIFLPPFHSIFFQRREGRVSPRHKKPTSQTGDVYTHARSPVLASGGVVQDCEMTVPAETDTEDRPRSNRPRDGGGGGEEGAGAGRGGAESRSQHSNCGGQNVTHAYTDRHGLWRVRTIHLSTF